VQAVCSSWRLATQPFKLFDAWLGAVAAGSGSGHNVLRILWFGFVPLTFLLGLVVVGVISSSRNLANGPPVVSLPRSDELREVGDAEARAERVQAIEDRAKVGAAVGPQVAEAKEVEAADAQGARPEAQVAAEGIKAAPLARQVEEEDMNAGDEIGEHKKVAVVVPRLPDQLDAPARPAAEELKRPGVVDGGELARKVAAREAAANREQRIGYLSRNMQRLATARRQALENARRAAIQSAEADRMAAITGIPFARSSPHAFLREAEDLMQEIRMLRAELDHLKKQESKSRTAGKTGGDSR